MKDERFLPTLSGLNVGRKLNQLAARFGRIGLGEGGPHPRACHKREVVGLEAD